MMFYVFWIHLGIPTYTKSSLPTHTRTNSISTSHSNNNISNSNSNTNLAASTGPSSEDLNPYTQYNNSVNNTNNHVFTAREGINPIKKNNFMSIHNTSDSTTATTIVSSTTTLANRSGRNLTELNTEDTNTNYPYPTNINTTTTYSSVPASPAHAPRRSNFGSENSSVSVHDPQPEEASENYEFADPIEVFDYLQIEWKVYITEHGDVYYLDMVNEHSQWEDPRLVGIVYHNIDAPTESPYKSHTPPKSPSPKGLEKSKTNSFHFNPHSYSHSTEESPRVKDIKPIKLNWAGKGHTKQDAKHNSDSPDSSEDEAVTALKVRYPRAHIGGTNGTSHLTLIDADEGEEGDIGEEQLELAHITAQLDFESSVIDEGNEQNGAKATQNGSTNRIKELSKQFEKKNSSVGNTASAVRTPTQSPSKNKSAGNRKEAASPTTAPLVRKTASTDSYTHETAASMDVPIVAVSLPIHTPTENVNTATNITSTPSITTSFTTSATTTATASTSVEDITRAAAEVYIAQLLAGRTLQEISEGMDKDGRSQGFKLQVLEWADEALILGAGSNTSAGGCFLLLIFVWTLLFSCTFF